MFAPGYVRQWLRERGWSGSGEYATCELGYTNNHHRVSVTRLDTEWGEVLHLWIERHDERPGHDWPTLQRIKDEIAGPDRVAIEVYPKADDVIDDHNIYHLYVLPEDFQLPFGLKP